MAFIRLYEPSDEEAMIHVFRETASPDLRAAGDPALHYASYNWARPYMMLVPAYCRVIDDGSGTAVGYVLGVPNTKEFVADFASRYLPSLEAQGLAKPSMEGGDSHGDLSLTMQQITWQPELMLHREFPKLLEHYPAHLHIDILPTHQRKGFGRELIETTLDQFRHLGVSGVHLGKVGSNIEAGKFYTKLGFDRYAEVMDDGKSGETGRVRDGGVCLVKQL